MKNIQLIRDGVKYYLQYLNKKIELSTKWVGLDRPKECRAVLSGLNQITKNELTKELFESTFSNPNALIKFSFQINTITKKYDYDSHKAKIIEIAQLLDGLEKEYFIECVIKLIAWGNQTDYWNPIHLLFAKKVIPDLMKLLDPDIIIEKEIVHPIRNLNNTYIYDSSSKRYPEENLRMNRIIEAGGIKIQVCCPNTINIINNALEIGLMDLELNVFVESFNLHPLSDFSYNKFRIANKLEINISELISKIEKTAKLFKNVKLKQLFLKSIYDETQKDNENEAWASMLLEFNTEFNERFGSDPSFTHSKPRLSMKQIALIHIYKGQQINRSNAQEIAMSFGYSSSNSGEGLFQDYNLYSSQTNRTGRPNPHTPKKLANKIKLFESILDYLSIELKDRVLDEIKILKSHQETD